MEFNQDVAKSVIRQMKEKGFKVSEGLEPAELSAIESAIGTKLPLDLKALLSEGVPLHSSTGKSFPNWHGDPTQIIKNSNAELLKVFISDIEYGAYWSPLFGEKPEDLRTAKEVVERTIGQWPVLIPIYGHRYMCTAAESGNPVLSVFQAIDTVYYGYDLADYLHHEFKITTPLQKPESPLPIPYWDEAFELKK